MLGLGWQELLSRWDAEWHAHLGGEDDDGAWLGAPPATDADVAAAEERLGVRLPPSYRAFLAVSNGWRRTGTWVAGLRPVQEIGWFRDLEREWYDIWREIDDELWDVKLMARAIVVSSPGEDALLLDPAQVDAATGEWHACTFSNKHPGAAQGSTFREEMEDLYLTFVRFDVPDGETVAELARRADDVLGRVQTGDPAALSEIAALAPYDWRADVVHAQADLLRRDSLPSVSLLWSERPTVPVEQLRADPVVLREIVPAWVVTSQDAGHDLTYEVNRTPEPALAALRGTLDALAAGGQVADFGYAPAFAAAVEEARALLADDPEAAWRRIVAALPDWRPMAPHHLAPMGLLHDRDLGRLLRRNTRRDEYGRMPADDGAWRNRVAELLATPRG